MKLKFNGLFAAAAALAVSCTLGACSHVVPTTGPHPALTLEQVKIYQKEPWKYEDLGRIEMPVTPDMKWDERGDSDVGFETLMAKAGALGANGVLLKLDQDQFDFEVIVGYKTKYYQVPMKREPRRVIAQAIFVVQE